MVLSSGFRGLGEVLKTELVTADATGLVEALLNTKVNDKEES